MPNSKVERRYDFDALRGIMMLLGIVLHSCVSFTATDTLYFWPYEASQTSLFFDVVVGLIHLFRIPVFFIASGFFLSLQLERKGIFSTMHKRFKRILVPFVIFTFTVTPFVIIQFIRITNNYGTTNIGISEYLKEPSNWNTIHFWFLYYLIIYHCIHFIITKLKEQINFTKVVSLKFWFFVTTTLQLTILTVLGLDSIHGDYSFLPKINSLLYFGTFYFLGTKVYHDLKTFDNWLQHFNWYLIASIVISSGYLLIMQKHSESHQASNIISLLVSFFTVLSSNILVLSCFAFFKRYCSKPLQWSSRLIDSAYVIYVIHLPILISILYWVIAYFVNPFISAFFLIFTTALLSILGYLVYRWFKRIILTKLKLLLS